MHIALSFFVVDAVQNLRIGDRAEGGDGHNLSLASGEHGGTVYARNQANLTGQRTNLIDAAAINALALIEQPSPDDEFLQFVDALVDLCLLLRVNFIKFCVDFLNNRRQALFADILVVGIQRKFYFINCKVLDCLEHIVVNFLRLEGKFRFADLSLHVGDKLCDLFNLLVTFGDGVEHGLVVHLVRTGLDHDDLLAGTGNGQLQVGTASLPLIRADDNLAVHQAHLHAADWAVPRNVRDGQREGGTQHTGNLRGVILIDRQNGHDDRNVVAHIFREQRTDRTVYQTGGQDGLLGRTSLSLEEGTGDFAHRIQLLLKIDRKREKVDALARLWGRGYIDQNGGVAVAHQHRAVCQAGHLSCFKGNLFAGKLCFKHSKIFKHLSQPP